MSKGSAGRPAGGGAAPEANGGSAGYTAIHEVDHAAARLSEMSGDLLIVPVAKDEAQLPDAVRGAVEAAPLDAALELHDFKGDAGDTLIVYGTGERFPRVMLLGIGKPAEATREKVRAAGAAALRKARDLGAQRVVFALPLPVGVPEDGAAHLRLLAEGALLGTYQFHAFKTDREKIKSIAKLTFAVPGGTDTSGFDAALLRGRIAADSANFTRDLGNTPANHMTPTRLAEIAKEAGARHGFSVTVLDRDACEALGMGSFLSVARGSDEPPKLIVMEYDGGDANARTLALVGKAVTFDSGGISIKPSAKMDEMKFDMCGGAAVIGAMRAVAATKLPLRVVGVVPATENLPSGKATKPGDVVRAMNGKTVEVLNTDAEGRLILADALAYVVEKHKPAMVVDFATLTGAVIIALGHYGAAVLSNDDGLWGRIEKAAQTSGDRVWRLPIWEEFPDHMRGETADLKNIADGSAGGGTIAGATFLKEFVGDTPWAHVDIAGTAWWEKDRPHLPKGASGFGVRLALDLLEGYAG